MKNILNQISIILVSYNSASKLKKFIKKIPKETNILIVDNSKDFLLKKIFKKRKNVKIYYKSNQGYGSSINFAAKKIKTPYFLVAQPDVSGINKKVLITYYKYAKKLNDKFSAIGPHFINAPKKGHFQTDVKKDIVKIRNVHGSTIFFNKKIFFINDCFDKNIFLYWEETDYTKRASKKGFFAYQLNKVKVRHDKGKAVETTNINDSEKLKYLYIWHFIWSKYYFFKKHYGIIFSTIYFIPIFTRIIYRLSIYKNSNLSKYKKYYYRLDGLKASFLNKKSSMRLEKII